MKTYPHRVLFPLLLVFILATLLSCIRVSQAAGSTGENRLLLPVVMHVPPPPAALANGTFEAGRTGWAETSTGGYAVIVRQFAGSITAHGGQWAAWLGGAKNETSTISQQATIPAAQPVLTYWHWIASADYCGYDEFSLRVNGTEVKSYYLCGLAETNGWKQVAVDLSQYAGQKVTLQFRTTTDASFNSNLFIDDVAFRDKAALAEAEEMPALQAEPRPKPDAFPNEPDLRELAQEAAE